jgi:hypothetical protein
MEHEKRIRRQLDLGRTEASYKEELLSPCPFSFLPSPK